MSRVYKGTDGLLDRMVHLMSGNAYTQLVTELLIYAKRFGNGKNTVEVNLTEKDLAAQSGITRETVSREIRMLKNKGLVTLTKNAISIIDVSQLEKELME